MPAPAVLPDKNDLFAQYQILEDLGDFPNYSLFKVKAPNGSIKLWKKVDLQFSGASIETRLLPVIEKVSHPNLNAVSNSFLFQDKALLFVESEFPFKTLRHRLEELQGNKQGVGSVPGVPISELIGYIAQVADAIDYLNTQQHPYQGKKIAIYHRALSPDSLHLFEEKGKIICKVGDFGLAKPIIDSNEAARHSLGLTNYDYAPPEFDEGLTTNTSDQYSLATTYCELRTGKLPFSGTLLQKLQAQLSGNPDLSRLEPNERPILARALSREPQSRYPSCRDFVRQLQLALGGVVSIPLTVSSGAPGKPGAAEPAGGAGALFGGGNSGWALSAKPVGRTGGSLFNVKSSKDNAPAKPEGVPLTTLASASAPSAPAAPVPSTTAAAAPAVPAIPKLPEKKKTQRKQEPESLEGWSVDAPSEKSPPAQNANSNWTPGEVSVGSTRTPAKEAPAPVPAPAPEEPVPPPAAPAARAEAISPKGRETLELIKRKQTLPALQADPPSMSLDKQVTGSKYISTGSSANIPVLPSTRNPAARPGNRPSGALSETPAPPRQNNAAMRRPSTPNMGVPLPAARPAPATRAMAQPAAAANPMPRRGSGGLVPPPTRPTPMPFESTQTSTPEVTAPRAGASWLTMLMVTIIAFCIGMMGLYVLRNYWK